MKRGGIDFNPLSVNKYDVSNIILKFYALPILVFIMFIGLLFFVRVEIVSVG